MNTIVVNNHEYRIKKMNVIELMALRSTINFENVEKTTDTYNSMLERIEVRVKDDKWLQVKQDNDFYPAGLEEDFDSCEKLIEFFLSYLKSVFLKSSESK